MKFTKSKTDICHSMCTFRYIFIIQQYLRIATSTAGLNVKIRFQLLIKRHAVLKL